jgi:hypothetical protein
MVGALRHGGCFVGDMEMEMQLVGSKYTATCVHCARVVFREARRVGDVQLTMLESHLLVCRPLASIACATDVLAHCRVTTTAL